MIPLVSAERRRLAFEQIVEDTLAVLDRSEVTDSLGEMAVDLRGLAERAYLPGKDESGNFTVAPDQRPADPILIPLFTEAEQATSTRLALPIFGKTIRAFDPADEQFGWSQSYGLDLSAYPDEPNTDQLEENLNAPSHSYIDPKMLAQTQIRFGMVQTAGPYQGFPTMSRPVVYVRAEALSQHMPPLLRGAITLHELTHVRDFYIDGILCMHPMYKILTELGAYGVSAATEVALNIPGRFTASQGVMQIQREVLDNEPLTTQKIPVIRDRLREIGVNL